MDESMNRPTAVRSFGAARASARAPARKLRKCRDPPAPLYRYRQPTRNALPYSMTILDRPTSLDGRPFMAMIEDISAVRLMIKTDKRATY
ncbi:hypothetical protein EVAR_21426_1 [Eumeta japonica]|uniref:Uncharacterized protein n=1 Tax=Eumeta variegata TaxID=151549 RepID=A0A4C1VHD9_EUMVA|nr:hypothetical protein EVAR_21426_1 [Eumeta japonica]